MGCDIHAYLEYYETQDATNSAVHAMNYASSISMGRNYSLFNLLAGVRGSGKPVFLPRGIPQTPMLSFAVSYQYNSEKSSDGYVASKYWHTPGYLYKSELIEIRRRYLMETIQYDSTSYTGSKRKDALDTIENSNEVELMKCVFPSIECVPLNATIASMIAIENSGDHQSRFVFWFDS